jgi:phosphatidate cytidylyltransferase
MMWMTNSGYYVLGFQLHEIGWWLFLAMLIALPVSEMLFSRQFHGKNAWYSLIGFVYISLCWALMMDLRNAGMIFKGTMLFMDLGWVYPVVLIASIWINDTMAYIVGSFIGKTPFSSISPKKTWEGTAGGAILAVITVTLAGHFVFGLNDVVTLIVLSSIGAIFGTAGDLLESKLKRMAGVKDSGNIMPGHGGFLDRFDSLLLATPFAWLFIRFFI